MNRKYVEGRSYTAKERFVKPSSVRTEPGVTVEEGEKCLLDYIQYERFFFSRGDEVFNLSKADVQRYF